MPSESAGRTIGVTLGVSLVCSLLVSATAVSLQERQRENSAGATVRTVMADLELLAEGERVGEAFYRTAAVLVDRLTVRFPRSVVVTLTAALAVTAAIATLKPAQSFLGRVRDGRWDRAWFYQIPPVVDSLGSGARILNLSAPSQCYPLLGKHLGNDVVSTVQWRALTGGEALSVESLREHAIDYVFVHEPWPTDWPADVPVDLIYDDTETRALQTTPAARIYRVASSGPAGDVAFTRLTNR